MSAPLQNRPPSRFATRNAATTVTVAVIVLLAVGMLAYSIGTHQQPDEQGSVATGTAHVGTDVASVKVAGCGHTAFRCSRAACSGTTPTGQHTTAAWRRASRIRPTPSR
jgi:hypothetical protein